MYVDGVVPFPGDLICCIAEWTCVQYGQGLYDEETGQCLISGALTRVGSRDDQSECLGGRYIDDNGLCYFKKHPNHSGQISVRLLGNGWNLHWMRWRQVLEKVKSEEGQSSLLLQKGKRNLQRFKTTSTQT